MPITNACNPGSCESWLLLLKRNFVCGARTTSFLCMWMFVLFLFVLNDVRAAPPGHSLAHRKAISRSSAQNSVEVCDDTVTRTAGAFQGPAIGWLLSHLQWSYSVHTYFDFEGAASSAQNPMHRAAFHLQAKQTGHCRVWQKAKTFLKQKLLNT